MIPESLAWQNLFAHQKTICQKKIQDLFQIDPKRATQYCLQIPGLMLDFSRTHVTQETLALFTALAEEYELKAKIKAQLSGEKINSTEQRPVLHTLLRSSEPFSPELQPLHAEVKQVLAQMEAFCEAIFNGTRTGSEGKTITDIVHIGIGGSALGPELVTQALKPYHQHKVRCHFVANLDPAEIEEKLALLQPDTTLFILASKSFTTEETLCNALVAKAWLQQTKSEKAALKHFVAITSSPEKAQAWGIQSEDIFKIWDWVGGRYSLWSAMGLPVALSIGMQHFKALLQGAEAMDRHFYEAPYKENLPVLLAMLGIWYRNFFLTASHAVIPYAYSLRLLPLYLQQLEMESNGKQMTVGGQTVSYATAPLIWGSEGTNSQHSYHQWLHQGTDLTPIDFIIAKESHYDALQHARLYANCLAQAEVLAYGQTTLEPHRYLPGNKPSCLLMLEKLTPINLGALLALYEHKVFVQGIIWQINSFDQWGVEAGKAMAKRLLQTKLD